MLIKCETAAENDVFVMSNL